MMFTEPLAAKIIKGEKTATRRRLSDNPASPWWREDCKYEVGQVFTVNPGRGVKRVAECAITAIYKAPLGQMTEADAQAEGFEDRYAFWTTWNDINGAFDDQEVWVIEFKLTGAECAECQGAGHWSDWNGEEGGAGKCGACYGTGIQPSERGRAFVTREREGVERRARMVAAGERAQAKSQRERERAGADDGR
jgi:uncharacterized protein YhfF